MLSFRLKDLSFRASVLLPIAIMGVLISSLAWWLYSDRTHQEQVYQQERKVRVENLQAANDIGIEMWRARLAVALTWGNPRDMKRIAATEQTLTSLLDEFDNYHPDNAPGRELKRLVPQYVAESRATFAYFHTIDKAVKHGVSGSGKIFDQYALHISEGAYTGEWQRKALTAFNHLRTAAVYYNGFVSGMRVTYLNTAMKNINAAVEILEQNLADDVTANTYRVAKRYQEAMQMLDKDLNAYHQSHREALEMGAKVNDALIDLQNLLGEQGFIFADEGLSQRELSNQITIALLFAALAGAVVFSLVLVRSMQAQLQLPLNAAEAIGNQDLSQCHIDDGKNEFGELARSLDKMRLNIREVLGQIVESSAQLSSASEEVSAISIQSSANMQSQQEQLDSLSAAMEEMRTTSADIAHNAESSANATSNAAKSAHVGGQAIEQTVRAIRSVEQEMNVTTDNIRQLVEESQRIGSIVDVINAIADQTNLLALNAAIEAARAGEQGRGFAVVADEVRSLATRTQSSTEEIGAIIKRLQEQAIAAETTMTESVSKMSQGVDAVNRSGDVIQEMNLSVSNIFDMSSQIASATEQQTAVSEELGGNVLRITQASSEVTEGAQQTTRACEELSSLANQLHGMTSQFKL
ncbi:methyl-accepting chemotaxis protein [Enterovibrio coralii]|nr:HAMP domain-containing methyl-accepting chemotaxis protein [Enterovibrio coralii]